MFCFFAVIGQHITLAVEYIAVSWLWATGHVFIVYSSVLFLAKDDNYGLR